MREQLSKYKFEKLIIESFRNGLRLHFDSILLYKNNSFPSAFQLSVLALEEFSKSHWAEHYYNISIGGNGFPDKEFEQDWLKLLYVHSVKHKAFFSWGRPDDYSSKFLESIENGELELKKQRATYVGLDRRRNQIDVNSRISLPSQIKKKDAKQLISLLNDGLKNLCMEKNFQTYLSITIKDELLTDDLQSELKKWKHRSGLRNYQLLETRLKNSSK
jgi:AbiV family abortive infection protein